MCSSWENDARWWFYALLLCMLLSFPIPVCCEEIRSPPDLVIPPTAGGEPRPGQRVVRQLMKYRGTKVHHVLYLPIDWKPARKYPVIVEYAGNQFGASKGTVEGSKLGYGLTAGKGAIWVCLPYVNTEAMKNETKWWGDINATVDYCKLAVKEVCNDCGGDPKLVFLAGFSRGAIACNYIGLRDDDIASLWCGFICHSHYDGVRMWDYHDSDRETAVKRLARLGARPQFVSHEGSVEEVRAYLREVMPDGNFTFKALADWKHTDAWVLHDNEARTALRNWFRNTVREVSD